MAKESTWLVRFRSEGVWLRYATTAIEVDGVTYYGGLDELELERGARSAELLINDEVEDWPSFASLLDGQPCEIDLYDGTDIEAYVRGTILGVEWGSRGDPLQLRVEAGDRAQTSVIVDTLARVDGDTWPTTALWVVGQVGRPYPLVFGTPGNVDGTVDGAYCVVPVPIVETGIVVESTILVCEDAPSSAITQVRLRNSLTGAEDTESVTAVGDLLGRSVRVAKVLSGEPLVTFTADQNWFHAGYATNGGSGVGGTVYDAITYLLRRRGALDDVDWQRWPEIAEALAVYRVDTWVDDPAVDPWAWVRSILAELPVRIRSGPRGLYLTAQKYGLDPRMTVGTVSVEDGEAVELSPLVVDASSRANEFSAYYRANREGDWLERVILTGAEGVTTEQLVQTPASDVRIVSPRCTLAQARYGLVSGEALQIDWTWDRGTIVRILEARAERDAFPAIECDYRLLDRDLRRVQEGDQVLLTDEARGLVARAAIVIEPPVVSTLYADVRLRIPRF